MKFLIGLLFVFLMVISCNHFDSEELDTQFLYFRSASFNSNNASGFDKGSIPDVHVLVDGKNTGIVRLPQSLPFIPKGESAGLIILPAVSMNGAKSNSTIYPPLLLVEKTIDRDINGIDTIDIIVDYKPEVVFDFLSGFEFSNNFKIDLDEDLSSIMQRTKETSFEGEHAGYIHLTKESPIIHVASNHSLNIDKSNVSKGIYLEITFKGDVELFLGLALRNTEGAYDKKYKLFLTPKSDWTTVYVDLSNEVLYSYSDDIKLLLGAEMDTQKFTEANIYIDNIKLLYL